MEKWYKCRDDDNSSSSQACHYQIHACFQCTSSDQNNVSTHFTVREQVSIWETLTTHVSNPGLANDSYAPWHFCGLHMNAIRTYLTHAWQPHAGRFARLGHGVLTCTAIRGYLQTSSGDIRLGFSARDEPRKMKGASVNDNKATMTCAHTLRHHYQLWNRQNRRAFRTDVLPMIFETQRACSIACIRRHLDALDTQAYHMTCVSTAQFELWAQHVQRTRLQPDQCSWVGYIWTCCAVHGSATSIEVLHVCGEFQG